MRKIFLSHKKKIAIAGVLLVAVLAFIFSIFLMKKRPPSSSQTASSTANVSSGQQAVDTGLSLQPPSSTASIPSVPPKPVYSGCELSLDFILTQGQLQSSGNLDYTLAAKNLGETTCQAASISVYYAQDESYAASDPAATAGGYYWLLGNLAPGKEVNVALTTDRTAPLAASAVTDEACLSASNAADACSNSLAGAAPSSGAPAAPAVQTATAPVTAIPLLSGEEAGIWVWTPPDEMTQSEMQEVVNEAAANNFNAIYITVDDYLTATNTIAYGQSVAEFLSLAAQKNIAVDAEAGAKDWAEPQNAWEAADIMAFVNGYNMAHTQKFRGVQYDIEPYLLPQYDSDEGTVLTQYTALVDQLVQTDKADDLPLTIVVPLFYDENEGWTPQITIDGVQDYPYRQVVRLLNELPAVKGRVIEMAYRNFATGADSAIALSAQEVQDANSTNVKVLIAQETGPVTPSYVTFYGTSRAALFGQLADINQAFASDTAFGGIAVDYLDPFLELE